MTVILSPGFFMSIPVCGASKMAEIMRDEDDASIEDGHKSAMSEMDKTEDAINKCFYRLETLEKKLKYRAITNDEREATEKEVTELKKVLLRQENLLQSLRSSNRGSTAIAVILIFLAFLTFGLYKMYINNTPTDYDNKPTNLW